MAIIYGGLTLPTGLRWENEFDWSPIAVSSQYTITGALVLHTATKQAGRPLTLVGGRKFCWTTRSFIEDLQEELASTNEKTITLDDARQFLVVPDWANGPLVAYPKPVILDSGPANPSDGTIYVIERIFFIITGTP